MTQSPPPDYPSYSQTPTPTKSSVPIWLIAGGIGVLALGFCAVIACVGIMFLPLLALPVVLTEPESVFGNNLEVISMTTDCAFENPDLDRSVCEAWAEEVYAEHPGLGMDCSVGNTSSAERYQCILDEGVDPPQ
jgi:hypothetical protein